MLVLDIVGNKYSLAENFKELLSLNICIKQNIFLFFLFMSIFSFSFLLFSFYMFKIVYSEAF